MIEIRRIRLDEAVAVRELVRVAVAEDAERYPDEQIGISEHGLANLETAFRLAAVHEDEIVLVAVESGAIVGFVWGSLRRGRSCPGVVAELDWLHVRPDGRGRGLERRLAEAAVAWARERGVNAVFVYGDRTRPESEPWQSLGFQADVVRYSLYE